MRTLTFILVLTVVRLTASSYDATIAKLAEKLPSFQEKQDLPYRGAFKWAERKGLFQSEIRMNFHGTPVQSELRTSEMGQVDDSNPFVTLWILNCWLEASFYGRAPYPSVQVVTDAVEAVDAFNDKNLPLPNPVISFWPQTYNTTGKIWTAGPDNLMPMMFESTKLPWGIIEEMLRKAGNVEFWGMINNYFRKDWWSFASNFLIAPDFDSSFTNQGFGTILRSFADRYPNASNAWTLRNANPKLLVDLLKKYAYRPFAQGLDANLIDTRSYFYLREFLDDAKQSGNTDLALITTWFSNFTENMQFHDKGRGIPFWNSNNIDVVVVANSVYGLTASTLADTIGFQQYFDAAAQKIYLDNANLLAWAIKKDLLHRRDLTMTYYPAETNFYWFAARTLFLLESTPQPYPFQVFATARNALADALRVEGTSHIFSLAKSDPPLQQYYFDDFLGNDDLNIFGGKSPQYDDRIFTTAQAINALISTWSRYNATTTKLEWITNATLTPTLDKVKQLVSGASDWLNDNVLNPKYRPWNAFFSGDFKEIDSLPFWYPATYLQFMNGTHFDGRNATPAFNQVIGINGYVAPDDYANMLAQVHYGEKTPLAFNGFNARANSTFPFWNSEAYTYAASMLALSLADQLSAATAPL